MYILVLSNTINNNGYGVCDCAIEKLFSKPFVSHVKIPSRKKLNKYHIDVGRLAPK